MTYWLTKKSDVTEEALKVIAYLPTRNLFDLIQPDFFHKLTDAHHMRIAYYLAEKSYNEGGCPIGALVVHNETNLILGKGHNLLVQENNPRIHGEGAAIADAGRIDFSKTNLKTTLAPCDRCFDDIYILGFRRIVIGDASNVTESHAQCLRERGVRVDIVEDEKCVSLYKKFCLEKPELNLEDWKGLAAVNSKNTSSKS